MGCGCRNVSKGSKAIKNGVKSERTTTTKPGGKVVYANSRSIPVPGRLPRGVRVKR